LPVSSEGGADLDWTAVGGAATGLIELEHQDLEEVVVAIRPDAGRDFGFEFELLLIGWDGWVAARKVALLVRRT
jgi:hypothetical protein